MKTKKKARLGRPPMGKTARTLIVLMRISPVEKAVWTKAAKAAGMKLGPWLLKPRRDELNAPKGE